ncbi:uncharacterized protein LOC105421777 [Amborella trichopoda]|uniref:uncharacterized protein LOC105421777 n=1 Tax=Amborella trichopoda TaxID=13333 RepID=UPI0009BF704A|nr:uncharacterized protein LOC105421777 [Amborella trichopoda]|eukprot:XP_020532146.1 uncharacterized protein LOC105421777 [Amborella trichopoda]
MSFAGQHVREDHVLNNSLLCGFSSTLSAFDAGASANCKCDSVLGLRKCGPAIGLRHCVKYDPAVGLWLCCKCGLAVAKGDLALDVTGFQATALCKGNFGHIQFPSGCLKTVRHLGNCKGRSGFRC